FSVTVKTIFENSPIPLSTWFDAVYISSSHKKGISSVQLAKDIGITQKSEWYMLHRIREGFKEKAPHLLSGTVEVDETYIGGKMKNKHKHVRDAAKGKSGSNTYNKVGVMGLLQRDSGVKTQVIDATKQTFRQMVNSHVHNDAVVI